MDSGSETSEGLPERLDWPGEFELADGTRLVPDSACCPDRIEGDANHVFTLADVLRTPEAAEPFAGYVRR